MGEPSESPPPAVDLLAALREFEARCDKSDPQQLALLEQIREQTRALRRPEWSRSSARLWNDPAAAAAARAKPPTADETYR